MAATCAPDVYFPIEIAAREYSGHLLLAVELAGHGVNSVIGYKGAVERAMEDASRPGMLFYKNYRKDRWSTLVAKSVGQDPEAGFTWTNFSDFFAARSGLQMASSSDAYFCYGPEDHRFLQEKLPDASLHLTGSPRVSLWGALGRTFHADRIAAIREHFGEFVLFASSGFRGNPKWEAARETLDASIKDRLQEDDRVAGEMLRAAIAVARETGKKVVIRPHPTEDWTAWQEGLQGEPQISLESCFDLAAWIHASSAVVQRSSTAALEAYFAEVPVIAYFASEEARDRDVMTRKVAVPNQVAIPAVGAVELCETLAELSPRFDAFRTQAGPRELMRRKFLHPIESAPRNVADVIVAELDTSGPSGLRRPGPLSRFRHSRASRHQEPEWPPFGRPPVFKRRPLPLDVVSRDVRAAREALGLHAEVSVVPLERDCFRIGPA